MVILLIDSSSQIIDRLVDFISETQKEDITFLKATAYNDALSLLQDKNPDVIIADWNFSGARAMDILNLSVQLKNKPATIILSHVIDDYLKEQCGKLNTDFLFDKYDDFDKIPAALISIRKRQAAL
jgi:DNA-binding response OmpR family regulator